ncbi:putative RNA-directed DNA polymerase, eukaryota, reverse transcriptase zinc-binding domain protein [Tanacetum coccineum]
MMPSFNSIKGISKLKILRLCALNLPTFSFPNIAWIRTLERQKHYDPEFSIKRGLRQGDPLSPFLFILVMEGLHNAFEEAVGNGLITGVNIKNSTINVSHLFYADDVIITTDWNAKDMDNIIRVLHVMSLQLSWSPTIGSNMKDLLLAGRRMLISVFHMGFPLESYSSVDWGRLTLRSSLCLYLGSYNLSEFSEHPNRSFKTWKEFGLIFFGVVIKAYHGQVGGFDTMVVASRHWLTVLETIQFSHSGKRDSLLTSTIAISSRSRQKIVLSFDRNNNGSMVMGISSRDHLGVRNLAYLCDSV